LRKALPFILLALLAYTLAKKDMGQRHEPRFKGRQEAIAAMVMGLLIGFYDGFFGPGTGSFLSSRTCACWDTTFSTLQLLPS